ncbi:hypothetical protein ACMU_15915 [Actibacterium mucosum KCTC 23349]|uniref:Uncharacterized protein n=1 Tax=Actibacterium mucosum KCTC 23349 TaxID=1454373 RepID=A0A037ZFI2_9RHOB|nr:hypothetical protein [Actibacterium mucosum]KAJ55240.1 hypothetical protein ACMU_15915 [Actibacterium mucosum KCTC 23349]
MNTAELLFAGVRWWLTIGAGVAAVFLTIGIDRIDEDARGAYVFRPLLLPGVMLIWPLVLWRWLRIETGAGDEQARYVPPRATHKTVAVLMAAGILAAVVLGLINRPQWPADFVPQQISGPGE